MDCQHHRVLWEDDPAVVRDRQAVGKKARGRREVAFVPRYGSVMDADRLWHCLSRFPAASIRAALAHPDAGDAMREPTLLQDGVLPLNGLVRNAGFDMELLHEALAVGGPACVDAAAVGGALADEVSELLLAQRTDWRPRELALALLHWSRRPHGSPQDARYVRLLRAGPAKTPWPVLCWACAEAPDALPLLVAHADRAEVAAASQSSQDAILATVLREARTQLPVLTALLDVGVRASPSLVARTVVDALETPEVKEALRLLLGRLDPAADPTDLALLGEEGQSLLRELGATLPRVSPSLLVRRARWAAVPAISNPPPDAAEATEALNVVATTLMHVPEEQEEALCAALEFLRDCGGQLTRHVYSPGVRQLFQCLFESIDELDSPLVAAARGGRFNEIPALVPEASPEEVGDCLRAMAVLESPVDEAGAIVALEALRDAGGIAGTPVLAAAMKALFAHVFDPASTEDGSESSVIAMMRTQDVERFEGRSGATLSQAEVTEAAIALAQSAESRAWHEDRSAEIASRLLRDHCSPDFSDERLLEALAKGGGAGAELLPQAGLHVERPLELLLVALSAPDNHRVVCVLCDAWRGTEPSERECERVIAAAAAATPSYRYALSAAVDCAASLGSEALVPLSQSDDCEEQLLVQAVHKTRLPLDSPEDLMRRMGRGRPLSRDVVEALAAKGAALDARAAAAVATNADTTVHVVPVPGALEEAVAEAAERRTGIAVKRLIRAGAEPLSAAAVDRVLARSAAPELVWALRSAAVQGGVSLAGPGGAGLFSSRASAAFLGTPAEPALFAHRDGVVLEAVGRPLPRRPLRAVAEFL